MTAATARKQALEIWKFGGASLADGEAITRAAARVIASPSASDAPPNFQISSACFRAVAAVTLYSCQRHHEGAKSRKVGTKPIIRLSHEPSTVSANSSVYRRHRARVTAQDCLRASFVFFVPSWFHVTPSEAARCCCQAATSPGEMVSA